MQTEYSMPQRSNTYTKVHYTEEGGAGDSPYEKNEKMELGAQKTGFQNFHGSNMDLLNMNIHIPESKIQTMIKNEQNIPKTFSKKIRKLTK